MNPRVINKAVDRAMQRAYFDPHYEQPPARRMESMQPSLFAPHVDITRTRLGFGRVGLRIINRDLHSDDYLTQLQALHTVMDQVQISESAMFLINIHVVYRLIDLMMHKDPVIREKVCIILGHLATYHQGRQRIMNRIIIVEKLMKLIMRDRKEIRYAAANTLKTLARDRCACEFILQDPGVVENLLKMIKHDHVGIVLLHLRTFENLTEWDPVRPLKANAFQVMLTLFGDQDPRIVASAMICMAQLCKHEVGRNLADEYDLTFVLRPFIKHDEIEVVISAVGLMAFTTLTTRSKWRAKEICMELTKQLVLLCHLHNKPPLQLKALQTLINLADCPDIRHHMKKHRLQQVKGIPIRTHEDWAGNTETSSYGLETGHHYRTMCIEGMETIKNDWGDDANVNPHVLNVHSYIRRLQEKKKQLIAAINFKSYHHTPDVFQTSCPKDE
ncbi:hypothetical protein NE865_12301 [Phthorimaea operculella]|nr:hypothetical protein NE865_12301 [Phthorimaea operculella]